MLIVAATDDGAPLAADLAQRMGADWAEAVVVRPADPIAQGVEVLASVAEQREARARGEMDLFRAGALAGAPRGDLRASSRRGGERLEVSAWTGPPAGNALRRAARLVDRVLVVVPAGALSAREIAATATRLGRREGIGYAVVGLAEEHVSLPDRVGPVDEFWNTARSSP